MKEIVGGNFGHKLSTLGMMDQEDRKNTGTLHTFGEFHRDGRPVHRFSNPVINRSHINFIVWDLWEERNGNVPAGSGPPI